MAPRLKPELPPSEYVPTEVLARHFSLPNHTVLAWTRMGYIPKEMYIKVGNLYRFKMAEIVKHLTETVPDRPPIGGSGGDKFE